ncbi:MAG TPA: serine/threonine protein kinase, partial [Planctomycetes bacterium]|nr:serine/threonine protein kinase [Planctomycetota bacterium]
MSETTTLGPYVLLERLDPRAEVYRARHEVLDREVVVKLARRDPQDEEAWHRFEREARAAARVDHPGVVRVFDFGQAEEGLAYLAQELVPGESLRSRLERGTLGASEWLRVARGLAAGLGAIHAADLVHRDLKPENVVLRASDEEPVLVDFGLARDLAASQGPTRTGQAIGSPGYWAPEQASGQVDRMGPWTDVYGLGGVLYACLTGRPPIEAHNFPDAVIATMRQVPDLPSRSSSEIDRALDAICLTCLAKAPEERYPDAAA